MTEVPEDEIKVNITLGHVGRHCILHALTVIEAAISQVCSSVCVCVFVCVCVRVSVCVSLFVCTQASMYSYMCMYVCACTYIYPHNYSNTA